MAKSAAFGIVHILTSFGVGYALTGSVALAGAITLVEPLVNTVAHYGFDKAWDRWAATPPAPVSPAEASGLPAH
ncbi:MAG: DUF2061 domain-containing protein [Burkholderiales bacterium]|nr:DUF2061 domain-containing protein [Burkholderiales bacterium]